LLAQDARAYKELRVGATDSDAGCQSWHTLCQLIAGPSRSLDSHCRRCVQAARSLRPPIWSRGPPAKLGTAWPAFITIRRPSFNRSPFANPRTPGSMLYTVQGGLQKSKPLLNLIQW